MSTINKSEKRRGRPPKNLVISSPGKSKIINKEPSEEQLVLYLPTFDEEETQSEKMRIKKETTETEKNNFTSDSESESEKEVKKYSFKHLTDKNESNDSSEIITNNINVEKLLEELQKRDAIISGLRLKVKDKNIFNENTLTLTKENKKQLLNLGLITVNKNKLNICEKTNIACWWCTYTFETQPLFMPDHYKNNIYHVFGNFCSFSCMLAYNEDMDDYRKSVRTNLIKQLYRDIFNCDDFNIKPAGTRELLEKFGGPLTIAKYRDSNIVSKKILKMSIPPQIPLLSDYEEIVIDK